MFFAFWFLLLFLFVWLLVWLLVCFVLFALFCLLGWFCFGFGFDLCFLFASFFVLFHTHQHTRTLLPPPTHTHTHNCGFQVWWISMYMLCNIFPAWWYIYYICLVDFTCVECLFICSVVVSLCGWYLSLLIMCAFSLWSLHEIIYVIMISYYSTSLICQFMSHGLIIKHLWRGSNWK